MATLRNGVMIPSPDYEDKEHLTLKEEICEPDSDGEEPIEDEDLDEDDDHENFVRRFFFSSHCTVCLYLGLFLIFIGSVVALVVISVQVVIPFQNVRHYLNATCIPSGVIMEEGKTCMCGAGCNVKYRCISIKVTYQDRQKLWKNATIFENESTLGKQCSFYPQCKNSAAKVEEAVQGYEKRYGVVGLPFNCYFSPQQPQFAIRSKRFQLYHVVNGILWSTLILIMTVVALLYTVKKRGCNFL